MLRTFHAKVPATTWIFLAALFFLAGYSAWFKQPVILLVALLLLSKVAAQETDKYLWSNRLDDEMEEEG